MCTQLWQTELEVWSHVLVYEYAGTGSDGKRGRLLFAVLRVKSNYRARNIGHSMLGCLVGPFEDSQL